MASVNQAYNTLKSLVNKDQKGFVTPSVFNDFAQVAQLNVFNKLFSNLEIANRQRLRNTEAQGAAALTKQTEEDLAVFSKVATLNQANGVFAKPDDLARVVSATTFGPVVLGNSYRTNVQLVYDNSKIDAILLSDLSKPSETAPVALVSSDIEVFPSSIKKIRLVYYKQPEGVLPTTGAKTALSPRFGYTVVAGKEVYSASNSVDFELPDHLIGDIIVELAKLIGINLRDNDVFAYTQSEQNKMPQ